ncbi:MAG: class I SAM-dependent methyltransferase [Acidobacteria bacterium]|nr:class I SAM-dependent methyltransferase [Acidobacteriota bacterium]
MASCRFCGAGLKHVFCDLGLSPVANAFLKADQLGLEEPRYPLCAYVCDQCFLVQLEQYEKPEQMFKDYVYFSSYSDTWLDHSRRYAEQVSTAFGLTPDCLVVEIGSNDGYLLQFFKQRGVRVLGIEPAENVARAAIDKGIPTLVKFFGAAVAATLARDGKTADLLVGNNVLAHVPDLNDFVAGMKCALKPEGVITLEFPHLLELIEHGEFDTIYHEHFSYFSFLTAEKVLARHGFTVFDVESLPTHGGSLRIYARHAEHAGRVAAPWVEEMRVRERAAGLVTLKAYSGFGEKARKTRRALLDFLTGARQAGKKVAGYGAPAKGNTLLNYCGIGADLIEYTVDRNPHKQGLYLPGSRIPVFHPDRVRETRPDYLLILPWNLGDEVIGQMACIREWGGKFVTAIPAVVVTP